MTLDATITLDEAAARVWDAVVVGAGPAGAMAAREMALLGTAVLLVDKAAFPRWKVCGCCLNASGQVTLALAGLGGLVARLGAVPVGHFHVALRGRAAHLAIPHGVALSREVFDTALVQAAIAAGVDFLPETPAQLGPVASGARRVTLRQGARAVEAQARVVLAADGLSGRLVAGEPEGRAFVRRDSRIGAGLILEEAPAFYQHEVIYMACGRHGYTGLVRLPDGRVDLGAALAPEAIRAHGSLGAAAAETLREAGLPPIAGLAQMAWRGTPALTRRLAAPAGERWFAVGDAAAYVEPFTGEGMAWALMQGRAVAPLAAAAAREWSGEAAREWRLLYERRMRRRQRWCRVVAIALRHPAPLGLLLRPLAHYPRVAAPLLRAFTLQAVRE